MSNFLGGLNTFAIGIIMVFLALMLLIALIQLVSKVVTQLEKKNAPAPKASTPAVAEPTAIEPVKEEVVDDLELVAVIIATIATSLGTTTDKLQVRSLRRVERHR
ncbi:MAG: hypothetical protein ATN32_06310 [Candidatus Epulonipiscium fishelsonii]|nr:MAG: hypothetical protein ATN32_06310 [Epulopiscium sp. AS2M-Bin002]